MKGKISLIALALLNGAANGFVAPSPSRTSTKLYNVGDPTGFDSFSRAADVAKMVNMPVGEAQRPFRRTVYTHDDWKKHRSQDRFFFYLLSIFRSGVYKNLYREVAATLVVAGFVLTWNTLASGYTDFDGVSHGAIIESLPKIGIPMAAFTLTSPSLGLLLVFRTNSAYQRWDEARKNWGMNINHTRDLVRMGNAYYDSAAVTPEQRQDDLNHLALCTWAFVRAMKRHLSPTEEDEEAFKIELYEKLPKQQADMIIAAAHRPNRALQDLSYAIDDLPMHFIRKNEVHRAATIFEDNLGSSERILTSPVPLFYSRHLTRYLGIWLLLLPFGLYDTFDKSWNHLALLPAVGVISTMLFGIEEIGTQLEEPFTVLPMQAFCDKIYNWCMEIVSWAPGDNGRPMKWQQEQYTTFETENTSGISGYEQAATLQGTTAAAAPPQPVSGYTFVPPQNDVADMNAQWAAASKGQN